jgi:hypothetical protein
MKEKNFGIFSIVTNYQIENGDFKKELLFFHDKEIATEEQTKWFSMIETLVSTEEWNFLD